MPDNSVKNILNKYHQVLTKTWKGPLKAWLLSAHYEVRDSGAGKASALRRAKVTKEQEL